MYWEETRFELILRGNYAIQSHVWEEIMAEQENQQLQTIQSHARGRNKIIISDSLSVWI